MTIAEQLHNSVTHKSRIDQNCPVCNPTRTKLKGVIARLQSCARTNDAEPASDIEAHAVAAEQWRMVRILKDLEKEVV